jgi:5-formyltetrahydrofolate cyclo-ligase
MAQKSQLRQTMRRALRNPPYDSAAACNALNAWLVGQTPQLTLASFAALPGEVDLSSCVAAHPQIRWVFPRVCGTELHFHQSSDFSVGAFGILEPSAVAPRIALDAIDAFLCPGLAFSGCGGRLGRGRGFYDRALSQARGGAVKIGVCFPFQIVANTFSEPHDVRMDLLFY